MSQIQANREFMKSVFGSVHPGASDQSKGVAQPLLQVPHPPDAEKIVLPKPETAALVCPDLRACIENRRSRRRWDKEPLTLPELSFLLWATQGVREVLDATYATMRTIPSAGARHAYETYLAVNQVDGLLPGVYRYLPLVHDLVFLFGTPELRDQVSRAVFGQRFVADAPVTFFWSCVPYRGEWRYNIAAHKVMLLDAGHICQNLYLACEALGLGTCAIGAYDQAAADALLRVDGQDEFVVYLAPVGKVSV